MTEYTILYVEDDQMSRDVMRMLLIDMMGYSNIYIFNDSSHFIDRLLALPHKPDVILLDIHMEPLNGFEVLKLILQQTGYEDTPVVALTASVMNEEMQRLRTAGFNAAIAKPIKQAEFPELLTRIAQGETLWHIG